MKKVCFFVGVKDKQYVELVQSYKNDIDILKDLGYKVKIATTFMEIDWSADLYYAWWPTKGILPLIVAKLRRKPILICAGGSEVVHLEKIANGFYSKNFIQRKMIKFTLRHADRVLSISKSSDAEILSLGCNKSEVVYLAIDTKYYKPMDATKKYIYTISHLNHENVFRKRIWTVLKSIPYVIEKFPNQVFVFTGNKLDAFEEIETYVKKLNIENNVIFTGKIDNELKLKYLSETKIYVQPTIHEGFGVAIAEAMSCGIPVITTKVAATPEVVGDTGLFCDSDDPIDLANKICYLLADEKKREDLSKKARNRIVSNFSYEHRLKRVKEIINSLK